MPKYSYVSYLSADQAKAEIICLGNDTGAEVNNYAIRQAIAALRAGQGFPLLDSLDQYVARKYSKQVRRYLGDVKSNGELDVAILRDKMNLGLALEAKYSGRKDFIGDCLLHGCCEHTVFGSKVINYKCRFCVFSKMERTDEYIDVVYDLDRNLLLADFIQRNLMDVERFSMDCRVMPKPMDRYLSLKETITLEHWLLIKHHIRKCLRTGNYAISKGLEFTTIFGHIIEQLEKNRAERA